MNSVERALKPPPPEKFTHRFPLSHLQPRLEGTNLPVNGETPPAFNAFIRCPLPPIGTVNPDNLRQFYRPGVQQKRLLSL